MFGKRVPPRSNLHQRNKSHHIGVKWCKRIHIFICHMLDQFCIRHENIWVSHCFPYWEGQFRIIVPKRGTTYLFSHIFLFSNTWRYRTKCGLVYTDQTTIRICTWALAVVEESPQMRKLHRIFCLRKQHIEAAGSEKFFTRFRLSCLKNFCWGANCWVSPQQLQTARREHWKMKMRFIGQTLVLNYRY